MIDTSKLEKLLSSNWRDQLGKKKDDIHIITSSFSFLNHTVKPPAKSGGNFLNEVNDESNIKRPR